MTQNGEKLEHQSLRRIDLCVHSDSVHSDIDPPQPSVSRGSTVSDGQELALGFVGVPEPQKKLMVLAPM
jgi:hypothetical protein